ncbi:MAG: PAS domain S-box protein [bacterium]
MSKSIPKERGDAWVYSVRTKLTLATSVLIAVICIFIYWFFPSELKKQALAAAAKKANSIATMMSYNISPALLSDDRPTVCDVVISAKHNPQVDYVMVLNDSAYVIATFDSTRAIELNYVNADFAEKISEDGLTYETVSPIASRGKYLGRVYLGLSLESLNADIERSRKTIALVSLCIGAFGILFVIALSTLITKPLIKMVDAAEKISAGDLKQRTHVNSKDEVGHLATVFNAMLDHLEAAHDDLQQNEKNYRELFETNPHPMWVYDIETLMFLDVNDAAIENYGYSREEFLRMTIHEIVHEMSAEEMQHQLMREGVLDRSVGWRHQKKNGTIIDVEMSSHSLPLRNQRKARLVLATDITKRLSAEMLLRESEERYRDLFESASDLIQSVGPDFKFQFVNRAWMERLGYAHEEMGSMTLFDIVKNEELPRFRSTFSDVLETQRSSQIQTIFVGKDGSDVIVEGNFSCRLKEGKVISIRGIFRDVTERTYAEEAVLMQKTRFEQLFENAPIGIVLADRHDNVVHANGYFQQMFGYSLGEIAGRPLQDTIIPEEFRQEGNHFLEEVLSGDCVHTDTVRARKGGERLNVTLYVVPILVRGETMGFFGMYVDISERKRAEETQALLVNELENTNKELNDFAYIVSHDLKAPLRGIGSLVNWLTTDYGEKLGEEGNKMMQILLGRTMRMHDLIDGILKYSRIGRAKDELHSVALDTLVPEIVEFLAPPEHIEVKIQTHLPMIIGEKTRLQQVFQNLLSNAVKFMDKPEGVVEIGCERENGHWKFSVSDNGPGIEERHFGKVFQIFQTLSPRDDFESTGIGLTIVKKIVETNGGRIWLESKVGTGTKFYFTWPAYGKN